MLGPQDVVAAVNAWQYNHDDEYQLQDGIAAALDAAGIPYTREHRLTTKDRVDFLAGNVGIEVKVAGDKLALARQLQRYAHHPDIEHLVVVTTRRAHRGVHDAVFDGVPVHVVHLLGL